jgi:3-oxoadipyl-CoA thiolase
MRKAYIVDGTRSPIAKHGGALAKVRPDDLAAEVIKSLMSRFPKLDLAKIDDVILGNANGAGEENRNVGRMAALLAGLPYTVPGETVNRLCASGMNAVANAARNIKSGDMDLIIAGGVESMTRAPFVLSKAESAYSREAQIYDTALGWRFVNPKMKEMYGVDSMGETAENLAELYNISRESQDEFALASQTKATKAQSEGKFDKEITSIKVPVKKDFIEVNKDEFIRPETTLQSLAGLKPVFRNGGSVTAGNASGINDGAAALIIASEDAVKEHNLDPIAELISFGVSGVEPRIMGIGPVTASQKALAKAGLDLNQMDLLELNEAFAAQVLSCTRTLGLEDNDERINPYGGAIALGHPLGMSGARLLLTAAYQLKDRNLNYALCTMCIGVGQGFATIIKRV